MVIRLIFDFKNGAMVDRLVEAPTPKEAVTSAVKRLNRGKGALIGVPYTVRAYEQGAMCFEIGQPLQVSHGVLNGMVTSKNFMFFANEDNYKKLSNAIVKNKNIRNALKGDFRSALYEFCSIPAHRSRGCKLSEQRAEAEALKRFQSVMDRAGRLGIHFENYELMKGGSNES